MFVIHGSFGHLSIIKSLSWGDLSVRLVWAFYVVANPQVTENCLFIVFAKVVHATIDICIGITH